MREIAWITAAPMALVSSMSIWLIPQLPFRTFISTNSSTALMQFGYSMEDTKVTCLILTLQTPPHSSPSRKKAAEVWKCHCLQFPWIRHHSHLEINCNSFIIGSKCYNILHNSTAAVHSPLQCSSGSFPSMTLKIGFKFSHCHS